MTLMLISSNIIFKIIEVMLTSSIKFLFAPVLAANFGFNFVQSFIIVSIGGILSLIFFYLLSEWILLFIEKNRIFFKKYLKFEIRLSRKEDKKEKKIFTKKNRMIIRVLNKYGFWGIVFLTPIFLTIPLGTFLALRYYHEKANMLLYLSMSVLFWSFVMSFTTILL